MLTPPFNPQLTTLFHRIITDQIALTNLFPSLVKFYANVETTGYYFLHLTLVLVFIFPISRSFERILRQI